MSSNLAENVLLTMGPRGVLLASSSSSSGGRDAAATAVVHDVSALLEGAPGLPEALPPMEVMVESLPAKSGRRFLWYRLLRPLASVRDTTGAGDALLAGAARAFAAGWPLEEAVVVGMLCAHVTLFVDGAVAPCLNGALLRRLRDAGARSRL